MNRALQQLVLIFALFAAWLPLAHAHKPSDSYLSLTVADSGVSGRWDIALRDIDFAIGLDADGNGEIDWGEVRRRHADIAAYALARLSVSADGATCRIEAGAQQIDEHTDGAYTVIPLALRCNAGTPAQLAVDYRLFADLDPQHRGLLNLQAQGSTRSAVLGPQAPTQSFDLKAP
ncbi:MAG: HupE/UreJ family protein, partial [Burkholderiaceae bacterium]